MDNQNYTNRNHPGAKMREVSLPRLLLLTLRRWRSMVLVGILVAALLAGMKVLREYRNRGVSNTAHEEYLAQMEVYNASVEAYQNAIERFQAKIDAKQNYFNESLLMQIDPHNECVATASLVVTTPGLEAAGAAASEPVQSQDADVLRASNLVHAFADYIASGISYDNIAADLGVPEQSVRELVLVTADQYHFSSVFKVQARSMDMATSARILEHILSSLDQNRDAFREALGDYEMAVASRSEETAVDTALLQQQTELQNSIATLQKNLQTSQTSLKELVRPTEATGASGKTILKHGIKYAVVGFVGGIFLMVLLYAIRILMTGKILTDDEVNVAYGLRNLMTFPAGAGKRKASFFLDRWVEKLVSDAPDMGLAAAGDVLIARVENLVAAMEAAAGRDLDDGTARSVLLVGTVDKDRLASLAASLNRRAAGDGAQGPVCFAASADLDRDASAVRRLREAYACILVEEIGESSYRAAAEVAELALASGKAILGTVYLCA